MRFLYIYISLWCILQEKEALAILYRLLLYFDAMSAQCPIYWSVKVNIKNGDIWDICIVLH
jgi:hypothetical protein